jgi:hypothetical protein
MEKLETYKVDRSIYELIQEVRYELSKLPLKKTGYNKHLNYYYYELANFLPSATKLMYDRGLCPIFNIGFDSNGVEVATLSVTRGAERVVFTCPTSDVPNMNGIFNTGSKITYMKRYLYSNLLDLCENDVADQNNGESKEQKIEEKKATPKQVEMIRGLYDKENIAKMIEYYGIGSLEELSLKQASEVIARKKK